MLQYTSTSAPRNRAGGLHQASRSGTTYEPRSLRFQNTAHVFPLWIVVHTQTSVTTHARCPCSDHHWTCVRASALGRPARQCMGEPPRVPLLPAPARKYPGPALAAVSDVWKAFETGRGNFATALHAEHRKHGNVVRIGPNEVSDLPRFETETAKSSFRLPPSGVCLQSG